MSSQAVGTSSLLVRAVLAYSVHEHQVGTAKWVRLELQRRSFIVEDDGRGMGLDRDGYLVGLLEQLAGRGGEVALHGIGLAIVAMSSPMLSIESRRGGLLSRQAYAWGIAQGPVHSQPADSERGTRVTVTLPGDAPEIESGDVLAQVEAWRATHPNLEFEVVIDEKQSVSSMNQREGAPHLGAIAEAEACLDGFTASFNRRDPVKMDQHLHFPHLMLSGAKVTVWQSPGRLPADFFETLMAAGWTHSTYEAREPLLVTPDKIHFRVQYSRRARDGAVLSAHENVWIVTRIDGRWGIAVRSY
jgi:hypothetical protein